VRKTYVRRRANTLASQWIMANLSSGALEGLNLPMEEEIDLSNALREIAATLEKRGEESPL
jgi:hypothetical protein